MKCCDNIECINCFLIPCAETIMLPIVANETGTLKMVFEFNHANIRTDIEVQEGTLIEIPNNFNENYSHEIRFYQDDGSLLNDTCYILNTMATIFTNPKGATDVLMGRFDFVGGIDQITFSSGDSLVAVEQLIVATEKGVLTAGAGIEDYSYDPLTGTITFGQSIEGKRIVILYWKKDV